MLCSTIDGYLSCLQWLVIVNKAALHTLVSSGEHKFTSLLGQYPRVELLGYRAGICVVLGDISGFPKWLYHFTFPPAVYENSSCPTSLPTLDITGLTHLNYSGGCLVASHCGFICISLMTDDVEHLCMCLWSF